MSRMGKIRPQTASHTVGLDHHSEPKNRKKHENSRHITMGCTSIGHADKQEKPASQAYISQTRKGSFQANKSSCQFYTQKSNNTSSRLYTENFKHHHPNICVCDDCNCGRHFCQFHSIKPDLTKKTVYKKDYLKKKPIKNKINISGEYDKLKGPNLSLKTTYLKDYSGDNGDQISRPKPQDQLKTCGPAASLTSYGALFPGHRGENQYIKPTDRHVRGYLPFRTKTTYKLSFTNRSMKKDQKHKIPDNLKTGSNWYGCSTYSKAFQSPNIDDYCPKKYTKTQRSEQNPDDKLQFDTTYRKSFIQHMSGICPAKIAITKKTKGQYSERKDKFSENTDFKALSPNFQAFSTSKNYYV